MDTSAALIKNAVAAFSDRLHSFPSFSKTSDFTITCGEKSWNVHRLVLCVHSNVLDRACAGDFKEAAERKLDLSDHHPVCVQALVQYLYEFKYNLNHATDPGNSDLALHVGMAIIADKYDMPHLHKMAVKSFGLLIFYSTEETIAEAAKEAHNACRPTTEIRAITINFCMKKKMLSTGSALFDTMRSCPDFAAEYAKALEVKSDATALRDPEKRYLCPGTYDDPVSFVSKKKACGGTFVCNFKSSFAKLHACPHCGHSMGQSQWSNHVVDT